MSLLMAGSLAGVDVLRASRSASVAPVRMNSRMREHDRASALLLHHEGDTMSAASAT